MTAVLIIAALVTLDLISAFFLFHVFKRLLVVEARLLASLTISDGFDCRQACMENAKAIGSLTAIVRQQGEELLLSRGLANANQSVILAAVKSQAEDTHEQIKKSIINREVLEAMLHDLYRRTEASDPDFAASRPALDPETE